MTFDGDESRCDRIHGDAEGSELVIDCGACEPECPVEAIYPEDALPEKWEPFVKINYAYGQGLDTVNELVQELVEQSPPPPIPGYRET